MSWFFTDFSATDGAASSVKKANNHLTEDAADAKYFRHSYDHESQLLD